MLVPFGANRPRMDPQLLGFGEVDTGEPETWRGDLSGRRQLALGLPQAIEGLDACALDDALDEGRAAVVVRLRELETEQSLDEPVGWICGDAPSPESLGHHPVGPDEPVADGIHHVVDVADDGGDDRFE